MAQLELETENIKIKFSSLSQKFKKSFLARQKRKEVCFGDLSVAAQHLFDFTDEYIESLEQNTGSLLLKILKLQSYVNFGMLVAIIEDCGAPQDIERAQAYIDSFKEYAKGRIFQADAEVLSKEIPGHEVVMFILDENQPFRLINASNFKARLCKLLGINEHKIILHKVEHGCIILSIQIPSNCVNSFRTLPLFYSRIVLLKEWCTRSYKLRDEMVHIKRWNILNSVKFGKESVFQTANADIVPVSFDGCKCIALKYTEGFSSESTADVGYIKYLDNIFSGQYKNIPTTKGVYYNSSKAKTYQYPVLVLEKLKTLEEVSLQLKIPLISQISILLDISQSVSSFEGDLRYQVLVSLDSVFIHESLHAKLDLRAKFCPLYGHSLCYKQDVSQDHFAPFSPPLPLEKVQWMNDVIKCIHFQGKTVGTTELPDTHILKMIFAQKWISIEDRYRPPTFKVLCEELQQVLGKFIIVAILTNCNNCLDTK